ncbi:MAG: DNA/RNA non-specific endonuclease [Pseudomonadota bacterium]|nr:DNA/RNA non-specific endonuclease [Pseudomonadota bacterium]
MKLRPIVAGIATALALSVGFTQSNSVLDWLRAAQEHYSHGTRTAQGEPRAHKEHKERKESTGRSRAGTLSEREALALYSDAQQKPGFDACADQFPQEQPLALALVPSRMKPLALCSDQFAVLYSQTSKTPLVVVERLNANRLAQAQGEERTDNFYADPRIERAGRADLADYRGQYPAVDRGHQSPAADAPTAQAMAQSFSLSNMVPQNPVNNRKIWNKIESDVRKFARRARGDVFVFTGPLFDDGFETVGRGKVWVPTHLFKLVYDVASGRAWAYVVPNAETAIQAPMDYADFVARTRLPLLKNAHITGGIQRS